MPIEVELPGGVIAEFPDGMAASEIQAVLRRQFPATGTQASATGPDRGGRDPGIDFAAPIPEVRARIAALPPTERPAARKAWAEARAAAERKEGYDGSFNPMQRGTFIGPFLDEIKSGVSGGLNALGIERAMTYDESMALQGARTRAYDTENPITSTLGQLAGGLIGGGAAMQAAKAPGLAAKMAGVALGGPFAAAKPAESLLGRMAQGVPMGAGYGYVHGFGNAEGGLAERNESGEMGAVVGGVLGGALPPVVTGLAGLAAGTARALTPVTARIGATIDDLRDRLAIKASGGGGAGGGAGTPASAASPGAEAAAEQVIANQLMRANVPAAQLRQRLAEAEQATQFSATPGRQATNVLAPVDLDPSLQRLAGSVGRQSPEAANIGAGFQVARQTGQPPGLPLAAEQSLAVRPAFSPAPPDAVPMGQYERVRDGLKRALGIGENDAGKVVAGNAYRTEQKIVAEAKEQAQTLYGNAYAASQGVDLRPVLVPLQEAWKKRVIDEPLEVAKPLERFMARVERALSEEGNRSHLERFDKVKQYFDGVIGKYFESSEGRNRYIGGVLTEIKNDYLAAIDKMPGVGEAYKTARNMYSSQMEMRDAIQSGREVFRQGSEVAVDAYRGLSDSPTLQKLFRLGVLDGFDQHIGRQKRTADVTQVFQSPRVQEILQEIIPRASIADRPERFGRFLESEKTMVRTRNETMGNSKTAERLADDRATGQLQSMVEEARKVATGQQSMTVTAAKAVVETIRRYFGMRADTAAEIARRLYTANPAERERLLRALEARMGPTRADHLVRLLEEHRTLLAGQSGRIGGQSGEQ